MNTPICDFVENYARSGTVRMHMPGHKGRSAGVCASSEPFTAEALDITEIHGADELFHADGIIAESETNASEVFGCDTYYSTEGSSLGIRAMLYLCRVNAVRTHDGPKSSGTLASGVSRPWVLAARNVHQTFVSACALLDLDVTWLYPKASLLSMDLSENEVRLALEEARDSGQGMPCCVYLTSPDYLGHILPIRKIADVCHAFSVPFVVDNAHGAYLKFLPTRFRPQDITSADRGRVSARLTGGFGKVRPQQRKSQTSSSAFCVDKSVLADPSVTGPCQSDPGGRLPCASRTHMPCGFRASVKASGAWFFAFRGGAVKTYDMSRFVWVYRPGTGDDPADGKTFRLPDRGGICG